MSTLSKVQEILKENFDLGEDRLKPEATLESLGLDSLDKIDLIFAIEDGFKIKIETSDIKVTTIQEMAESLDRVIAGQASKGTAADGAGK